MAKKLDRRLVALGAHPVLPKGLGDDQAKGGYEAALDAWLPQLWTALRVLIPLAPGYTDVCILPFAYYQQPLLQKHTPGLDSQ